jgi:hypothetical protein
MSRRPAAITQADAARVIRAAKQAGAAECEVRVGDRAVVVVRFAPSTAPETAVEPEREVVL